MTLSRAFIAISATASVIPSSDTTFCGLRNETQYPNGHDERPWITGESP
jgi:hypothetical protein